MKQASWIVCLLIGAAALVPAGLRALSWKQARPEPVDPAMAAVGKELFEHEWRPGDKLTGGDGLGPVYNATSCVFCHNQSGPGGSGDEQFNVTTFVKRSGPKNEEVREGVVHSMALDGFQEKLSDVSPNLPPTAGLRLQDLITVSRSGHCSTRMTVPSNVHISQRNTPALWGAKLIDELSENDIIAQERREQWSHGLASSVSEDVPVGRAVRLANGRIGRFGWKAQSPSLAAFVQAACANELGLSNPGQDQPKPLNSPAGYIYKGGLDLTQEQCDQLTAFCASLPRPIEKLTQDVGTEHAVAGKKLFTTIGCADCHTPKMGTIDGLYSDLLVHRMGQDLEGGGSYNDPPVPVPDGPPDRGPSAAEWRTPPLWGVADSAPYMHDGRARSLEDAIRLHGGQGARAAQRFAGLNKADQDQIIEFLKTLRAPTEK
jgi:CxxC motif-containing protein (DUF1111 family)